MERKAGPVLKMDFQPELNPTTITDQPLILRQAPQLFPDNLPALVDNHSDDLPDKDIKKALKNIRIASKDTASFLEELIKISKSKDENKTLNRIISASFKSKEQTLDLDKASEQIKKDRGRNNVECYLQEKRILKRAHTLSVKHSGLITWWEDLIHRNIDSANQINNLENNYQLSQNGSASKETLTKYVALQLEKTRGYSGIINILTKDQIFLSLFQLKNTIYLQQKLEPAIYAEYYRKAQAISLMYKESPFKGIFSSFLDVPRLDYIILSVKSISGKQDPNEPVPIENKDYLNDCDPTGVLQFHKFDIEDPLQYPDYQLARHYLARINTWVIEHLFNKNGDTWRMIIDDNPKLKTISDLAKKLFDGINPDLQKDWMKEVVEKLDYMTNRNRVLWDKKLWQTGKRTSSAYNLEEHFFSSKDSINGGINISSLDGIFIKRYLEIHHVDDGSGETIAVSMKGKLKLLNKEGIQIDSNLRFINQGEDQNSVFVKKNGRCILVDPRGKVLSGEYKTISLLMADRNRIARNENGHFSVLNHDGQIIREGKLLSNY